jgi:hypothetical protein
LYAQQLGDAFNSRKLQGAPLPLEKDKKNNPKQDNIEQYVTNILL